MPKLIVLDLDYTLIYSTKEKLREPDFNVEDYNVYIRPGLDNFLNFCSIKGKVGIWSQGDKCYVEEVVSKLIGDSKELLFKWSKEECVSYARMFGFENSESHYANLKVVKDLNLVSERFGFDISDIIAVDDNPELHYIDLENVITATPWEGDEKDSFLYSVIDKLSRIKDI